MLNNIQISNLEYAIQKAAESIMNNDADGEISNPKIAEMIKSEIAKLDIEKIVIQASVNVSWSS